MLEGSNNEIYQEMYTSDENTDDVDRSKSLTPSVNRSGAQQPNDERGNNRVQGDTNLHQAIVAAL